MARKKLYNTPDELRKQSRIACKTWYRLNREKHKADTKSYRLANKDKMKASDKVYYINNKDRIRAYQKANKDKINSYIKNRKKTDVQFKLRSNLRARLHRAINRNSKAGSAVKDLGCSIKEFKQYLESKFQTNMNWDNWSFEGWHIDHIKPLASFDLTDREQLLIACHYTNLQPLWAKDNMAKGDKIISYNV